MSVQTIPAALNIQVCYLAVHHRTRLEPHHNTKRGSQNDAPHRRSPNAVPRMPPVTTTDNMLRVVELWVSR